MLNRLKCNNVDHRDVIESLNGTVAIFDPPYNTDLWEYIPSPNQFSYLIVYSNSKYLQRVFTNCSEWEYYRTFVEHYGSCYRDVDGVLDSCRFLSFFHAVGCCVPKFGDSYRELSTSVTVGRSNRSSHGKSFEILYAILSKLPREVVVDCFCGGGSCTETALLSGAGSVITNDIKKSNLVALQNRLNS